MHARNRVSRCARYIRVNKKQGLDRWNDKNEEKKKIIKIYRIVGKKE